MPGGVPSVEGFACVERREPSRRGDEPSEDGLPARPLRKNLESHLDLEALAALPDEDVIEALVNVKGIGRWSAEMFLIFRLHRPDVLPVGDLGIVIAVQRVYGCASSRSLSGSERSARRGGRIGRSRRGTCGGAWTTNPFRPRRYPPSETK